MPPPDAGPPPPTVVLKVRGYYEVAPRGPGWLNVWAVLRHRSGGDSLPRYALRLAARGD